MVKFMISQINMKTEKPKICLCYTNNVLTITVSKAIQNKYGPASLMELPEPVPKG